MKYYSFPELHYLTPPRPELTVQHRAKETKHQFKISH